jgi:hypothetical protein
MEMSELIEDGWPSKDALSVSLGIRRAHIDHPQSASRSIEDFLRLLLIFIELGDQFLLLLFNMIQILIDGVLCCFCFENFAVEGRNLSSRSVLSLFSLSGEKLWRGSEAHILAILNQCSIPLRDLTRNSRKLLGLIIQLGRPLLHHLFDRLPSQYRWCRHWRAVGVFAVVGVAVAGAAAGAVAVAVVAQ